MASSMDKHVLFTQWAMGRGVQINGVEPAQLPGRGLGLVTTKRLKRGERILFIPEKAMFKPDISQLKHENLLPHTSPQAQLAASAMLAFRTSQSSFNIWKDTWPTLEDFTESMPMCWSANVQQRLPPPVLQPLERQLADYTKDWEAVREFCSRQNLTEQEFKYYWLIVNSRSFAWKPTGALAGSMVMCPFIDYLNHGPTGSTCLVTMSKKGYEVEAERKYEAGEEVLATYGAHSNDKLLVHYGFIISGSSADDDIRLDHLILPQLPPGIRSQLQDVGFLGGYALLPAKNELCFKTQVAIRAVLLTCNEWEYFVASGEDLSTDQTGEVNEFVKKLLVNYREEAMKHVEAGTDGMIGLRWRQIADAIDTFSQT